MAKYLQQLWCKNVNKQVKFDYDMKLKEIAYSEKTGMEEDVRWF